MQELIDMFNRNLYNKLTPELCEGLLLRIKENMPKEAPVEIPEDLLETAKDNNNVNASTTN